MKVRSGAAAVAMVVSGAVLPGDRFGLLFWVFLFLGGMAIWKHRVDITRQRDGTEPSAWGGSMEAVN